MDLIGLKMDLVGFTMKKNEENEKKWRKMNKIE
jgi:hypothetical protein